MYLSHRFTIYKSRRRFFYLFLFFGSLCWGYFYSGAYGKNLYTTGYCNGFYLPFDYTANLVNALGTNDKLKKDLEMNVFMRRVLLNSDNKLAVLDWLLLGRHFAGINEDEVSFQAYYMAHLKDHQRIRTNSELKFETSTIASKT